MKTQLKPNTFTLLSGLFIIIIFSAFTLYYPSGSPGKYTGSPGDGKNCTQCHGGSATTQNGIISSDIDPLGYIGGNTYTITVSIPGSGKKGFEVSPQDLAGEIMGTLTTGAGTKLVNSNKAITQSSSSSSNPAIWTFQWTAPAKGSGDVKFYGAFTASKSTTLLSTLTVSEKNTSSIDEQSISTFEVYPNPARENIDIDFILSLDSWVNISIISLQGKTSESLVDEHFFAGNHHISMNIPDKLSPGTYILQFESAEGKLLKRIMIEN